MRHRAALSTELTHGNWPWRRVELVGEGASSRVFRAEGAGGRVVALKVARDAGFAAGLADEGERLLLVDSPDLSSLVEAGTVPAGVPDLPAGVAYVALEWAEGSAPDVAHARWSPATRHAVALAVARDVAGALVDLHAAGSSHGDVKPANVVVHAPRRGEWRARLVDLGLGDAADEVAPRGGSPRYFAPEVFDASAIGDGRARDLWALGVTLAEIADADVARDAAPAEAALRAELPPALAAIVRALLAPAAGARPSAAWVRRRAGSAADSVERRRRAVRRAYLAVRRPELLGAARNTEWSVDVGGAPGQWLEQATSLASQLAALRARALPRVAPPLRELDALGKTRWLVALIGPDAARWPLPPGLADAELAERLLAAVEHVEPASLSLGDIEGGDVGAARPAPRGDAVAIALGLGAGRADAALLDAGEQLVFDAQAPEALALALARALRLRGQPGRALAVLDRLDTPAAQVEAAETLRRAGGRTHASELLSAIAPQGLGVSARARRAATLSRLALEDGDAAGAIAVLDGAALSAPVLEARALAEIAQGRRQDAERSIARARPLALDEEERARVEAAAGALAHYSGDAVAALELGERAVDHAARAGAVVEEATYLTSVAAAAANVGDLGRALAASARAIVLFEHLGRARDAARAQLSRAAVYATAGAAVEARDAALDAILRARDAGDARCRAYAHLALADVAAPDDPEGVEHARRAAALVGDQDREDRLWVGARLVARGAGQELDVAALDQLAGDGGVAVDARLSWWGARAACEAAKARPQRPDVILSGLAALAGARAPVTARGPALASGAALAARAGDGEMARRLAQGAGEAARELARRVPAELAVAVRSLAWVAAIQSPREAALAPEQIEDIETLVRALAHRDRLRPLLDQVLDALVLWTGVERGLLLLRAPGGRLVPRAARNLARSDLTGPQLELSQTLAMRALSQGEPVVAVDAAGELPEVHRSVHALKLRSVLAVPLVARGESLGVVYLDDRARRGAFGPRELSWVKLVAALAAVAIADARDQILLKRAARRARRAEARVAETLARREAELDVAERELARARDGRETRFRYDAIIGKSEPLAAMLRVVDRVTTSEVPVLIVGESGSGKELVARAIHDNGPRGARPFVGENCGAIPESLLESALFGHVRGAFTGASSPRAGLFEVADRGTLFLDEIAEMSPALQTKLLRVLEDGVIHPVGSERPRHVDVRVIGATHRDLDAMATAGSFRRDLLYRLDVISIRIPPLRERPGDVALLVHHFIAKHAQGRRIRVSADAMQALSSFSWPGNVRQLENELRRALVLADDHIDVEHLSPEVAGRDGDSAKSHGSDLRSRVDALEKQLVREALGRTGGNQTRAAELLGLSRFGLQKMMRRLGIAARGSR